MGSNIKKENDEHGDNNQGGGWNTMNMNFKWRSV